MQEKTKDLGLTSLGMFLMAGMAGCAGPAGGAKSISGDTQARAPRPPAPRVGEQAPGFDLRRLENQSQRVKLASFSGEKPVILFLGSYT